MRFTPPSMQLADFDFDLPEDQHRAPPRQSAGYRGGCWSWSRLARAYVT